MKPEMIAPGIVFLLAACAVSGMDSAPVRIDLGHPSLPAAKPVGTPPETGKSLADANAFIDAPLNKPADVSNVMALREKLKRDLRRHRKVEVKQDIKDLKQAIGDNNHGNGSR